MTTNKREGKTVHNRKICGIIFFDEHLSSPWGLHRFLTSFFKVLLWKWRGYYNQIIIHSEDIMKMFSLDQKLNYIFFFLSAVCHGQNLIGWKILCWDVGPLSQTVPKWVLLHKFTWSGIIKLWSRSVKCHYSCINFPVKTDKIDVYLDEIRFCI